MRQIDNIVIGLLMLLGLILILWSNKKKKSSPPDFSPEPEPESDMAIHIKIDEDLPERKDVEWGKMDVLPHLLLFGPPGTGKTQFTKIITSRLAPVYGFIPTFIGLTPIQLKGYNAKKGLDDLILEKLMPGTILFIDEIHGIDRDIAEALYSAMQDGEYHYNSAEGKEIYQLPPFTLVGATTDVGKVVDAMRDRFIQLFMEKYTPAELKQMSQLNGKVSHSNNWDDYIGQKRLKNVVQMHIDAIDKPFVLEISDEAAEIISLLCRNNPRYERLLRTHATARAKQIKANRLDPGHVVYIKRLLGVDDFGFYPVETGIIRLIVHNQVKKGKSLGRRAIAQKAGLRTNDIDELINPMKEMDLLTTDQRGMLEATQKAIDYYGKIKP